MIFNLVLAFVSFLPIVLGHGHMTALIVDGQSFTGPKPGAKPTDSVIREVQSFTPITDLTSDDMSCGIGAANVTATQSAPAKPGSKIAVEWAAGSGNTRVWPHTIGPLMTYIASCGGNCSDFNSLKAKWVKIDQVGLENGDTATKTGWVQESTLHAGKSFDMTLPSDLPAGNYLLRHEIIALHDAKTTGGAQIYPACSQITVAGDATESINTDKAVSFPGAYKSSDPGIKINVFSSPHPQYVFPGPDVVSSLATGATSGNSTSGNSASSNSTSSSSSSSEVATSTSTSASTTATASQSLTSILPSNNAAATTSASCNGASESAATTTSSGTTTTNAAIQTPVAAGAISVKGPIEVLPLTSTSHPASSATPSPSSAGAALYPRRRSRIMGRRAFAGLH